MLVDGKIEESSGICVAYSKLSGRERTWRVQKAGNTIIAGWVDKLELLRDNKYYL